MLWTMSPPCQPYTRQGKQEDTKDPRAKPLLNLISVFPTLKRRPDFLLLENVKNFEVQHPWSELRGRHRSRASC